MKARLASYRDGTLVETYPLPEPGTTIGRDAENHIRLEDEQVSRRHCAIHAKDGMWVIKDQQSTNGIEVNGAFVTNAVLKHGDSIGIGPFYLIFETAEDGEAWEPAPGTHPSTAQRRPTIAGRRGPRPAPRTMPIPPRPKPGSA